MKRCDLCIHWTAGAGNYGMCEEIAEQLRLYSKVIVSGLQSCVTCANGECKRFDDGMSGKYEERADAGVMENKAHLTCAARGR